jgi:hypothetical protein
MERLNREGDFTIQKNPMVKEAAAAGLYTSPLHGKFPKIQLLAIEDLFNGHRPEAPFMDSSVFKKARAGNWDWMCEGPCRCL